MTWAAAGTSGAAGINSPWFLVFLFLVLAILLAAFGYYEVWRPMRRGWFELDATLDENRRGFPVEPLKPDAAADPAEEPKSPPRS